LPHRIRFWKPDTVLPGWSLGEGQRHERGQFVVFLRNTDEFQTIEGMALHLSPQTACVNVFETASKAELIATFERFIDASQSY